MKPFCFFVLLLTVASCRKESPSSPTQGELYGTYPTTLQKLSNSDHDSLLVVFNQKKGTKYLATLDEFGLLGHVGLLTRGKSSISDANEAISAAKTALLELSDFSNVIDTSSLRAQSATHYTGPLPNVSDWKILFEKQTYQGMVVWTNAVLAIVADDFVLLDGHCYKNIFVPRQNNISKERARDIIVGTRIDYTCWSAESFVIADSSINLEKIEQCIYPLAKGNSIELRVVWEIPISMYPSDPEMWYFFVDVQTGETVGIQQLFIC